MNSSQIPVFPSGLQMLVAGDVPPRSAAFNKRLSQSRRAWRLAWKGFAAPVFNYSALLSFLLIPLSVIFAFALFGAEAAAAETNDIITSAWALVFALPVWALLNLFFAPFRALKEEASLGSWQGDKFVFHEPQRVFTTVWSPEDNGTIPAFLFKEAEPGALVHYKIEIDGPVERLNCAVIGSVFMSPVDEALSKYPLEPFGKVRLRKGRLLGLACHALPKTVPAFIRVFVLAWETDSQTTMVYTDKRHNARVELKSAS